MDFYKLNIFSKFSNADSITSHSQSPPAPPKQASSVNPIAHDALEQLPKTHDSPPLSLKQRILSIFSSRKNQMDQVAKHVFSEAQPTSYSLKKSEPPPASPTETSSSPLQQAATNHIKAAERAEHLLEKIKLTKDPEEKRQLIKALNVELKKMGEAREKCSSLLTTKDPANRAELINEIEGKQDAIIANLTDLISGEAEEVGQHYEELKKLQENMEQNGNSDTLKTEFSLRKTALQETLAQPSTTDSGLAETAQFLADQLPDHQWKSNLASFVMKKMAVEAEIKSLQDLDEKAIASLKEASEGTPQDVREAIQLLERIQEGKPFQLAELEPLKVIFPKIYTILTEKPIATIALQLNGPETEASAARKDFLTRFEVLDQCRSQIINIQHDHENIDLQIRTLTSPPFNQAPSPELDDLIVERADQEKLLEKLDKTAAFTLLLLDSNWNHALSTEDRKGLEDLRAILDTNPTSLQTNKHLDPAIQKIAQLSKEMEALRKDPKQLKNFQRHLQKATKWYQKLSDNDKNQLREISPVIAERMELFVILNQLLMLNEAISPEAEFSTSLSNLDQDPLFKKYQALVEYQETEKGKRGLEAQKIFNLPFIGKNTQRFRGIVLFRNMYQKYQEFLRNPPSNTKEHQETENHYLKELNRLFSNLPPVIQNQTVFQRVKEELSLTPTADED